MDSLSVPRTWCHSAQRQFTAPPFQLGINQRSSSESQTQHRLSVQVLQRGRVTPLLVIPPSFSTWEQKRPLGLPALLVKKPPAENCSLSRLSEELGRRTVRAETEPNKQDEDKPVKENQSDNHLWKNGARSVQTTAQIIGSTMVWIVLFFVASIWDGEKRARKDRRDRGRRK